MTYDAILATIVGLVGKANVGKSTFFAATTLKPVEIAGFPFTTIKADKGVAYVRSQCVCVELGVKDNPQNSSCVDGVRLIPVDLIDTPGLIPGAHKGKGLGKTIDFPTANVLVEEPYKLNPKDGSYVIKTYYNDQVVYGMLNIGTNPTVAGNSRSIEMHLFDFKEDIYGEKFTIEFIRRLRDEQKFESIEALKSQLAKDKINSLEIISQQHA